MTALLEVDRLSVAFRSPGGTVRALDAVSLAVPRGGIVGVVGESGSGKSTLSLAILRLLAPNAAVTAGAIRFDGRDLLALAPEEMRALRGRRIAMVFQDPMSSLNPVLTIGAQIVDIQLREKLSRRAKRDRAAALLDRVGIPDAARRLDDYQHQFSGGMRQRIAIAMALAGNPDLLVADEPTTALDVTLEAQILDLMRDLRRDFAGAILLISHQLGVIAELCDSVVVLYAGVVVEAAPVEALFAAPQHPYTRALLACEPGRLTEGSGVFPTIPGRLPDLTRPARGCIFAARCPEAEARCRTEAPQEIAVGPGHRARCHHAGRG